MITLAIAGQVLSGYGPLIKDVVIFVVVVALVYLLINIPEIPMPPTVRRFLNLALVIIAVLVIVFHFLLPLLGAG